MSVSQLSTTLVLATVAWVANGLSVGYGEEAEGGSANQTPTNSTAPAASGVDESGAPAASDAGTKKTPKLDDLLKLDVEDLSKVSLKRGLMDTNLTAPSNRVSGATADSGEVASTGDLLTKSPSVSARRVSAISRDPRVRGYHSSQLNASANGMRQLKTRLDIDSLFSQIDPGIVDDVTVIDGPYTSLYGPGFSFLIANLLPNPRFPNGDETHFSTNFVFGSNAQTLYSRDNALTGGKDWGMILSYGLRDGNDYTPGGNEPPVPSRYQKWDGMFGVSVDLNPVSRVEFNYLRTELNGVELPGIIYDIDNSKNDQVNLRYIVQEDRKGPEDLVVQAWWNQTYYNGNSLRPSKQETFYYQFLTLPDYFEDPALTFSKGNLRSLGSRFLRTFGERDSAQWTFGVDWFRYQQRYTEQTYNSIGEPVYASDIFGIPESQMDDMGVLVNALLPWSDTVSTNVGGRVDYCLTSIDVNDPVVWYYDPLSEVYYCPGTEQPNYTLGMAYMSHKIKLSEHENLRVGTAYAMRAPELAELYSDEPYTPIARFGNSYVDGLSNLKPEKALQLDLGIDHRDKKVSWGVRGFSSLVWDYIEPVPCFINFSAPDFIPAPHQLGRNFQYFPSRTDIGTVNENADTNEAAYQFVNINLATLIGGDMYGEVTLRDGFSVFGSMSYVRGVNTSPVSFEQSPDWKSLEGNTISLSGNDSLPGIYPFNGTVGARFFAPADDLWFVEFSSRMVAPQYNVATVLSEVPNPGFVVFNARGYYRLRKNLRVTLDLDNLLNRDYSEPGSLAYINRNGQVQFVREPGFSAVLGIDARF